MVRWESKSEWPVQWGLITLCHWCIVEVSTGCSRCPLMNWVSQWRGACWPHVPVVHQWHPHYDHLTFHELMLTDVYNIGDASIVGMFAIENFKVVVVVNLAHCMVVSPPMASYGVHMKKMAYLHTKGAPHRLAMVHWTPCTTCTVISAQCIICIPLSMRGHEGAGQCWVGG